MDGVTVLDSTPAQRITLCHRCVKCVPSSPPRVSRNHSGIFGPTNERITIVSKWSSSLNFAEIK